MKATHLFLLLGASLALSGCSIFGPKPQQPALSIKPPVPNGLPFGTILVHLAPECLLPGEILHPGVRVDGAPRHFEEMIRLNSHSATHHLCFKDILGRVTPPPWDVTVHKGEFVRIVAAYNPSGPAKRPAKHGTKQADMRPMTVDPGPVVESYQSLPSSATGKVDCVWSSPSHPLDPVYWHKSPLPSLLIHTTPGPGVMCGTGTPTITFDHVVLWYEPRPTMVHIKAYNLAVEAVTYNQ